MAKRRKKGRFLRTLAIVVGLLLVVAVLVTLLVDLDTYKPRVEAMASQATGMEVQLGGPIDLRLLPVPSVRVHDVNVSNQGSTLLQAESISIRVDWGALIRASIEPASVRADGLQIRVVRDEQGQFNFEVPGRVEASRPGFAVFDILVTQADFSFEDRLDDFSIAAEDCRVAVDHILLDEGASIEQVTVAADMACARVQLPQVEVLDLTAVVTGSGGRFELAPMNAVIFNGVATGFAGADFSGELPQFEVDYRLEGFALESFLEALTDGARATGNLDLLVRMTAQGVDADAWRRSASGDIVLQGRGLEVVGTDLDEQLARYESSQSFNLVDVGAFFFAGPLGVAVSKGHDFSQILAGSGGTTRIEHMVSEWTVRGGMVEARDVALATRRFRLAMLGRLDLVRERYDDLVVAVVGPDGCAVAQQTLRGPFTRPSVGAPSFLRTLTGPVRQLFSRARDLITGPASDGACEVVYDGAVAPPPAG